MLITNHTLCMLLGSLNLIIYLLLDALQPMILALHLPSHCLNLEEK